MATGTNKELCIKCGKGRATSKCAGCLQDFCYDHLTDHRQELSQLLDGIEVDRDVFRQTLIEQSDHIDKHLLIQEINQWEQDSIKKIQQVANECRQKLIRHKTKNIHQTEVNLAKLTDQLREIRQENDFNEIDLNQFKEKLKQLEEEVHQSSNVSIKQVSTPLINKISVVISSGFICPSKNIHNNTKWKPYGSTIAGGYEHGNQLNQLFWPASVYVDDNHTIYIADYGNHRIVHWKYGEPIVADANKKENRINRLNHPTDVIVDVNNDSLIISDWGHRRVVQWSRESRINQHTIISDIDCWGLAMDNNGDIYVSDYKKNEVRRWKQGDTNGIIVAGGNGQGDHLNQLNFPTYIFIDQENSVFVSDRENHRVMKWMKDAEEGIVVAGGHGYGSTLKHVSYPEGVIVDHLGNVYVADSGNHRIMRWLKESREGSVVVGGGNVYGQQPVQLNSPAGLAFDRESNLYVADRWNHRIQKFDID